jgi:hypothetical protein
MSQANKLGETILNRGYENIGELISTPCLLLMIIMDYSRSRTPLSAQEGVFPWYWTAKAGKKSSGL